MRYLPGFVLGLLPLAGCGSGGTLDRLYTVVPLTYETGSTPPGTDRGQPASVIDRKTGLPLPIDLEHFHFLGETQPAVALADGDGSGHTRNRLKAALVERSNLICQYTEAQIVGTNDWINFGLGETTTVLGAVGAVVTAATPARIFAGLAGLVNSTRSQVNEIFYQNALKVALIQKIDAIRADKLALMNSHVHDDLIQYSLEEMVADVREYHKNCSFFAGIVGLSQPNETPANDAHSPSGGGDKPKTVLPPVPGGTTSTIDAGTDTGAADTSTPAPPQRIVAARPLPPPGDPLAPFGGVKAVDALLRIAPTRAPSQESPVFQDRVKQVQTCFGDRPTGRFTASLKQRLTGSPSDGADGCPLPASSLLQAPPAAAPVSGPPPPPDNPLAAPAPGAKR